MINLPQFKELLGEEAKGLSDAEILKLRDLQCQLADLFFDDWVEKLDKQHRQTALS